MAANSGKEVREGMPPAVGKKEEVEDQGRNNVLSPHSTHTHTRTHTPTYTRTHAHTRAHTHTHTRAHARTPLLQSFPEHPETSALHRPADWPRAAHSAPPAPLRRSRTCPGRSGLATSSRLWSPAAGTPASAAYVSAPWPPEKDTRRVATGAALPRRFVPCVTQARRPIPPPLPPLLLPCPTRARSRPDPAASSTPPWHSLQKWDAALGKPPRPASKSGGQTHWDRFHVR